jgi:flagellar motor switch protein FliG
MSKLPSSLRKAAVLISALDERTAETLLAHMDPEQSAKVRSALVELNDISREEQQAVLAEFLNRQEAPAAPATDADEVSLDLDPTIEAHAGRAAPSQLTHSDLMTTRPSGETPLRFLENVAPEALSKLLSREQAQTIAVVVGRLPAEQAAAVLEQLPANLATEALERMAWLDDVSPDVELDLAHHLREQLGPQRPATDSMRISVGHLTAVLGAMDFRHRQRVVMRLGSRNTPLLRRLGLSSGAIALADGPEHDVVAYRYRLESGSSGTPRTPVQPPSTNGEAGLLAFDELALLDDSALRAVFAAVHPQVVLLALTAADSRLLSRILGQLPGHEATVLRRRLEHPGPLRLRDIEQARQELAMVASRLAREEAIQLPPGVRFAAAV